MEGSEAWKTPGALRTGRGMGVWIGCERGAIPILHSINLASEFENSIGGIRRVWYDEVPMMSGGRRSSVGWFLSCRFDAAPHRHSPVQTVTFRWDCRQGSG